MTKKLNFTLLFLLLTISLVSSLYRLGDFAHLMAEGVSIDMRWQVLIDIRLPRLLLAMLAGACLALAGNAMQAIFQNPLASPGLLGSSAGATAASVFVLYYFSASIGWLLFAGVGGALSAFLLVWLIARYQGTTMMILAGVVINVLLGATITLLLSNAESPWALAELYRWLQGSLIWARMDNLAMATPIILLGGLCLFSQRRYLDLLTFGEETAATMGIHLKRSFFIVSIGVALLLGATIPQTGTIGFIGLIAPHLARMLLHKPPSQLYITSALFGALLLLIADLSVQYLALFNRIYIGTLTAILGAPFLLWILLTERKQLAQ